MGTRYNIAITATDAATARVQAIKKSLKSITQPISEVGRSVRSLGKEVGVDKLAAGVGNLGKVASGAVRSIGGLGGAIGGLAGVGGITALAAYTRELIYSQSATLRFAAVSGVAAGKIQTMEGAAKLAGLETGDLDSAILNLGNTMQDARWGRNQGALLMMNRLGLRLKTTKEGAIDTSATLADLAEILGPGGKLGNAPVQTKALVAQQFGVESLLPILLKGKQAWLDYQAAAAKVKPPVSDADLKAADEYRQKIDAMTLSFTGLGNAIAKSARGPIGAISDWIAQHNTRAASNIAKEGLIGAIGVGTYKALTGDFGQYRQPKHADPRLEQESIDDFKRMGWSDAQAKGLVANMIEESGLTAKPKPGDGGLAKGVLQWHPDRQANYARFAAGRTDIQGKTIDAASLADQRKFINYELRQGSEQAAGKRIMAQTDAGSAAMVASQAYVRPAGGLSTAAQRGRTAAALDKALPSTGLQPSPAQDQGATALAGLWKSKADQKPAASETTVTLKIQAPAGTKAEVADTKGPVQTVLKVDYSMPDMGL